MLNSHIRERFDFWTGNWGEFAEIVVVLKVHDSSTVALGPVRSGKCQRRREKGEGVQRITEHGNRYVRVLSIVPGH